VALAFYVSILKSSQVPSTASLESTFDRLPVGCLLFIRDVEACEDILTSCACYLKSAVNVKVDVTCGVGRRNQRAISAQQTREARPVQTRNMSHGAPWMAYTRGHRVV
jgi:hypothetical protein